MTDKSTSTGSMNSKEEKRIDYKLGEYEFVIVLGSGDEFIRIESIGIDKRFFKHKSISGNFDAREFYEE